MIPLPLEGDHLEDQTTPHQQDGPPKEHTMFELTIGEYEDVQVLGTFETREAALIALGQYVLEHDGIGSLYPRITDVGDTPAAAQIKAVLEEMARLLETYPTGEDASPTAFAINCAKAQGIKDALKVIGDML